MKSKHHFKQEQGTGACGECSIMSILSMYSKILKVRLNTIDGIDEDKIKKILNEYGIQTKAKYIKWDKLKNRSICYYPRYDHWVVLEKIDKKNNRVFINDSDKDKGEWVDKEDFCNSWLTQDTTGYVIQCRLKRRK